MEGVLKQTSTPIFSPIPFLHDDARTRARSRSRSQSPPSPLRLTNALAPGDGPADEPRGLGLVDELDTPAAGHMATKPNPLTAVMSADPALSLSERFVKATETEGEGDVEAKKQEDAEVENMVLVQDEEAPSTPS